MTVRTQKLQVLDPVVQPVAILVVDVKNQRLAEPIIAQVAPLALATIIPP
jgi:hypothetical protein